jgi:tryptophan synthase alpha chain
MSRIARVLDTNREQGRKALIPYIVAGDPDAATTIALMHELVRQGADIIELGVPFSDPSSDGPVIQLGAERALAAGMTLAGVLDIVSRFREEDSNTPVVLMGYLNPIEIMGYETFAGRAAAVGVDGVLVVDLPVSESAAWFAAMQAQKLDTVYLVAPTTNPSRIDTICRHSTGYIYYVSLKGVTGAAITDHADINDKLAALREKTDQPIMVGFGIKDEESARSMALLGDGVIVGSALVAGVARFTDEGIAVNDSSLSESVALIGRIRQALDAMK